MARMAEQLSLFDTVAATVPKIGEGPLAFTIGTPVRVAGDERPMAIAGIVASLYGYTVETLGHGFDDPCPTDLVERFHARGWSGVWMCEDGATPYTGLLYFCQGEAVYGYFRADILSPA